MGIDIARERLRVILDDLEREMQMLQFQGVLNRTDVEKIRNQARVSKNALSRALNESSFSAQTRDKLLMALVSDFEHSVQGYLEDAVARKGDTALLVYKLNTVDNKIKTSLANMSADNDFNKAVSLAMTATRTYISASLPKSKGMFGSKIDVDTIVKNYNYALSEFLRQYETENNIRIIG